MANSTSSSSLSTHDESVTVLLSSPAFLSTFASVLVGLIYLLYAREATALRKLPGPFFASVTRLWLVWYTRQKRRHLDDIALHNKYGPVVRIAPTEVSIASPNAVSTIYGVRKDTSFRKGAWYLGTGGYTEEGLDLLGENNIDKYRIQRRYIGPIYSAGSMKDFEGLIEAILTKDIKRLHEMPKKYSDIDMLCSKLALDCLSMCTFSESMNVLETGDPDGVIEALHGGWNYMHWIGFLPRVYFANEWISKYINFNFWARINHVSSIFSWSYDQLQARISGQSSAPHIDIAEKLVSLNREKKEFRDDWMVNMTMTNFGAGVETTSITMSTALYYIVKIPGVKARIFEEIDTARKAGILSDPPQLGELQVALPFLDACIFESMRLHPVVGMTLPRVVPEGGVEIEGHFLPAGTTVGINPWVLNRDKTIFGPDADQYRPERWLEMTKDDKIVIDRYSLKFGHGARTCPGQYLAQSIYTRVIPALLMHFDWNFKDPKVEHEIITMFMPRLHDVEMTWTPRTSTL